jgi:hypothetical protein
MAESGMVMVWGFPNAQSHRGFCRDLGWSDIYEVPTLRLPLPADRSFLAPSHNAIELGRFDERFDRLWEQVRDEHPIIAQRDRRHLQWRYAENPAARYRILAYVENGDVLGYAVFKRYAQELQIVDLLTVPDVEIGLHLVLNVAQAAYEASAAAVSLWLNVGQPLHWALEKLGFRTGEPITYLGGLVLQPSFRASRLYDYHRWYLTMGDSDVF